MLKFVSNNKYFNKLYKKYELNRIKKLPRFKESSTKLLGNKIEFPDSASFISMYKSIIKKEIYKFHTDNATPYIIDAGANIGLSVIYLKKLYPKSEIFAFEPDISISDFLESNINSFNLDNISIIKKALWNKDGYKKFYSQGADGGSFENVKENKSINEVETVRLRDYLNKKVDFLKIDIEGAETDVLEDCQDLLLNVENLFVEYHSFVDKPQTLHLILEILHKNGFRVHVHPELISRKPFIKKRTFSIFDLQLNIFAYRK